MVFAKFGDFLSSVKTGMATELTKYKNKTFLDAIVAGCTMIAAADGVISPEEKRKMMGYLQINEDLKVFDIDVVIGKFEGYVAKYDFDAEIGKGECLKSISSIKNDKSACQLLVRVCCAIGAADGDFDSGEKQAVRDICKTLDLNPDDFGLSQSLEKS